jgi:hypothetical protein
MKRSDFREAKLKKYWDEKRRKPDIEWGFLTLFKNIFDDGDQFGYVLDTGINAVGEPHLRYYVGETCNPLSRWKQHATSLKFNTSIPIFLKRFDNRVLALEWESLMNYARLHHFNIFKKLIGIKEDHIAF